MHGFYSKRCCVVVGLMGLLVIVFMYSSYNAVSIQNPERPRVQSKPAQPTIPSEDESAITTNARNIVFRSSHVYTVFDIIFGIQEKNCRLTNNPLGQKGQKTSCTDLKMCHSLEKGGEGNRSIPATCERRFPGCIVIGVFKAGTTELLEFIGMHPAVVPFHIPRDEPNFFPNNWEKGLEYYRNEMPYSMPGQITLEKSPQYYNHPEVPQRIHTMDPNVKLILMVRDPVERLISHMTFLALIYKKEFIFRNATSPDNRHFQARIQESMYDVPFERYLRYFRRSQIHIVESEHFKHDPYSVLRGVESFLGLPHLIQPDDLVFNPQKGFFCLKEVDTTFARCFDSTRGRNRTIKEFDELRPELRKMFEPHNKRFSKLTGRTFDWA